MKTLKLILLTILFSIGIAAKANAQDYCTLQYWGKEIKIDRAFFQILNNQFSYFMNNTAPQWKYYDFKDYSDIYIKVVDNLKSSEFTIIVTEANQLQWRNAITVIPGTNGEKGRSKKSSQRASWILYQVLLPSLQSYAQNK